MINNNVERVVLQETYFVTMASVSCVSLLWFAKLRLIGGPDDSEDDDESLELCFFFFFFSFFCFRFLSLLTDSRGCLAAMSAASSARFRILVDKGQHRELGEFKGVR